MKTLTPLSVTYRAKLLNLYQGGAQFVSPRGMQTREHENETFFVHDMEEPVIWIPERKLSYRFMAAEAEWILNGRNDLAYHPQIKEKLSRFSDDGKTLSGAYGPKVKDQVQYVIDKLGEDRDTRQAVLTIWRENPAKSKDIPCTVAMQFRIRNNFLNTTVFMRSSDMYLGIPYDVFSFSCIAKFVQMAYNYDYDNQPYLLALGSLNIFIGSSHLYGNNFADVERIAEAEQPPMKEEIAGQVIMSHIKFAKFFDHLRRASNATNEEEAYEILCNG